MDDGMEGRRDFAGGAQCRGASDLVPSHQPEDCSHLYYGLGQLLGWNERTLDAFRDLASPHAVAGSQTALRSGDPFDCRCLSA